MGRRPGLSTRFAITGAVLFALVGVVAGLQLRGATVERAISQAQQLADVVTGHVLEPLLRERSLDGGLRPASRSRVEHRLDQLDEHGVVRLKLFDRSGRVIYSDAEELIGQRLPDPTLQAALSGETAWKIGESRGPEDELGRGRLLEVYVPFGEDPRGGPKGVFEVYVAYEPIAAEAMAQWRRQVLVLGLGLLLLYLALFRTVAQASARLRSQADENHHLARHDGLTGLPNRTLFYDRAEQALATAHRYGEQVGIVLIDLDRFREINDALGHETGDRFLVEVSRRLLAAVRDPDTVARLGGDEFVVLLPRIESVDAVLTVARRILTALRCPFDIGELILAGEASIGVACAPQHGDDVGELLRHADIAMYAAKSDHQGIAVYTPDLEQHSPEQLSLLAELRHAIDDGQLVLHYQPKVTLDAPRVTGMEALVRWDHPQRGLLAPMAFLPAAERTGLIEPLTYQVLDMALAQCRRWQDEGRALTVAVNLSARSVVDQSLPDVVSELLLRHGLSPHVLELELTESTVVADPLRAGVILGRLRDMGIRLAIDDYGTGYSSLAYLRRLPISDLKIDKSFVLAMGADPGESAIVASTIALARTLGLRVVAEGVETEDAWRDLVGLGCDAVQGYYVSRPVPADEIPALLDDLAPRLRRLQPAVSEA